MKKIGVEDETQVIALDMTASAFLEDELTVERNSGDTILNSKEGKGDGFIF